MWKIVKIVDDRNFKRVVKGVMAIIDTFNHLPLYGD